MLRLKVAEIGVALKRLEYTVGEIEIYPHEQTEGLLVDIRFDFERECSPIENALPIPMPTLLWLVGEKGKVSSDYLEFLPVALGLDEAERLVSPLIRAAASRLPIYLICERGNRSLETARLLRRSGFNAWSVRGGNRALSGANIP